jgi:hypothetical protein
MKKATTFTIPKIWSANTTAQAALRTKVESTPIVVETVDFSETRIVVSFANGFNVFKALEIFTQHPFNKIADYYFRFSDSRFHLSKNEAIDKKSFENLQFQFLK